MAAKQCTICNRQFSKTEHLRRHERSHTRERPYKCPVCHKSFARSDVLFRHCKKHEQDAQNAATTQSNTIHCVTTTVPNNGGNVIDLLHSAGRDSSQGSPSATSPSSDTSILVAAPAALVPEHLPERSLELPRRSGSLGGSQWAVQHDLHVGFDPTLAPGANTESDLPGINTMRFPDADVLLSILSPPPSSHVAVQQGGMPVSALDVLEPIPSLSFDAHNFFTQRSQDGTSEASQYELDQSWWLSPNRDPSAQHAETMLSELPSTQLPIQSTQPEAEPRNRRTSASTSMTSVPEGRVSSVQRFWVRGIDRRTKLMSTLWHDLLVGNGLFASQETSNSTKGPVRIAATWAMDEETQQRVRAAFCALLNDDMSVPAVPTTDMFDIAFEQYVYHHHSTMPICHFPTFSARQAPTSLLLVMCAIGFVVMGRGDLSKLVCRAFPGLVKAISDELHASGSGKVSVTLRLTAMMDALLVLILASLLGHNGRVDQIESLYVNLMSKAQCDGFFSADEYPLSLASLVSIQNEERRWRVWGSVESVKRLTFHLIQLDCWYATYLALNPSLRSDTVEIIPLCNECLFQAQTVAKWTRMRPDFSQMDYSVVSASYLDQTPIGHSPDILPSLLMLLQLRLIEASTLLDRLPQSSGAHVKLLPWKAFSEDVRSNQLAQLTINLAPAADERRKELDINCAISWHASCMMLGAYLPLFETAAGRYGPAAAVSSLKEISTWVLTPSARRCCLHAAQIFKLILNRKYSDAIRLHSMIALFQAALVLGLYVYAMPESDTGDMFDLYEEVDWVALERIGVWDGPARVPQSGAILMPAAAFVLNGGRISLGEFIVASGHSQARKCWLHFASLMLSLGRWKSRIFSGILHVMCDSLSDMDSSNLEDATEKST